MFGLEGMFTGWKVWAAIGIVIAIIGGSFSAGWKVSEWRLDAKYTKQLSEKDAQISDLSLKISTQNSAVDILDEKTRNAKAQQKLVADLKKEFLATLGTKAEAVANSTATDCEGVLKEAHEDAR